MRGWWNSFQENCAMQSAKKPLEAADFMQRDVITVSPEDTLRDALALMTANHVTGLPVMDGGGRCIGLVTASDILNYEQERADDSPERGAAQFFNPETQQWESVPLSAFGLEGLGEVRVEDVMARELIWVDRHTPLKEVARKMRAAHVHRVLVMNENNALFGIISAYDIVGVVAEP
jgi:CBS domain-containing protein